MAACKLASKGLTLLDSSYQSEVKNIQTFLSMQRSNSAAPTAQTDDSINTHSLVSPRYHKKYKPKQVEWPWKVLASVLQYLIQVICSVFVLLLYIKTTAYSIFYINYHDLTLFFSVNPSYPGSLSECRPAVLDICHLEVSADLASSAWLWNFLLHGQVNGLTLETQKNMISYWCTF